SGPARGESVFDCNKLFVGYHVKAVPLIFPLRVVVFPKQMVVSGPAFAKGYGTTFILIKSDVLHFPTVATKLYCVVVSGFANGFFMVVPLRPEEGDHVKYKPFVMG